MLGFDKTHPVAKVDTDEPVPAVGVATVSEKESVRSILGNDDAADAPEAPKHNQAVVRRLKARHIQLIAMGGTIGTSLFVQLAGTLINSGPGSLFISFALWCIPVTMLTTSTAEMVSLYPLPSPFIRMAGRCVDEAVEVAAGWTYFVLQALLVPYEITAVTLIVHFWRSDFTPAAVIVPQLGLYVIINMLMPVNFYGEIEFWMSIFKVILMTGLLFFTFITMVGGNPLHDAYGFRFWQNPGAFNEYVATGATGRFLGFFSALALASYTVSGPDYVSMTAGEAINPRRSLPSAFKGVVFRLTVFFVLGPLSMGIVCPSNDPLLTEAWATGGSANASGSPYVAAMMRLRIHVLPHIVNVGILTSAFSAGNSYFYCASRTLYGMALDGKAPRIFRWCTPNGVPFMATLVVTAFGLLSFLQLGSTATKVLNYLIGISTACELIVYSIVNFTFIRFYNACKAQGLDRRTFPYRGWFQPYQAWISFVMCTFMTFFAGYGVFLKGNWSAGTFVTNYIMIPVAFLIWLGWKVVKKTKFLKPEEVDLQSGLAEVREHEKHVQYTPPRNFWEKCWRIFIGEV